eukprot:CAMPEP_0197891432 /NCGR_PEP_ID=MMETSP1439-20131203/28531_1 /TAXON_ID=66791 /ORGANISM="Gonyaulax spinifera, Strain CCMP409" /LENGTH=76 /DNA_ID=CAMNT_0043511535 /DNA_START=160 /DNA_END=390 /DNA_ORIENTATION=-
MTVTMLAQKPGVETARAVTMELSTIASAPAGSAAREAPARRELVDGAPTPAKALDPNRKASTANARKGRTTRRAAI